MKNFLIKIIILTTIIFIEVLLFSSFNNLRIPNNHNAVKVSKCHQFDSLNYLFIGNSYTYSAIIPMEFEKFGYRAFNLGTAAAGVKVYKILTENYLNSIKKNPQFIFFQLSPITFSSYSDNLYAYPIYRYTKLPISSFKLLTTGFIDFETFNKLFVKDSKEGLKNLFYHCFGIKEKNDYKVEMYKGYIPSNKNFECLENDTTDRNTVLKEDMIDANKVKILNNLCNNLKALGIRVIFYKIPTFRNRDVFSKQYFIEYEQILTQLIQEDYDIIQIPMKLKAEYFRDEYHMNSNGAEVFTKILANQIIYK